MDRQNLTMPSPKLALSLLLAIFAGLSWAQNWPTSRTLLFPFGPEYGDDLFEGELDGTREVPVISTPYTFFGTQYSTLFVNSNGDVSFGARFFNFRPEPLVNRQEIFAALFWADHYVTVDMGQIWFRASTDSSVLRRGTEEVRDFFKGCGGDYFEAKEALVATWEQAYSYEYINGEPYYYYYYENAASQLSGTNRRQRRNHDGENCYQIVLLTDGDQTFAIYNYKQIEWYSSSGDNARVGFNSGDGLRFFEHYFSGSDLVLELPNKSNVGLPGRWMYKVSGDTVLGPSLNPRTGCRAATIP